jgi:putative ABC transport system substrate-binding protein
LELVPKVTAVAILINPNSPVGEQNSQELLGPARTLGLRLHVLKAATEGELGTAFAAYARSGANALIVANDPLFIGWQEQIAALTTRHAVIAIFPERLFAAAGGLMSYGGNSVEPYRLMGVYTGRILKGEKPAELPVQQSTKVELILNRKTAKALGLEIPAKLLFTADEVIE